VLFDLETRRVDLEAAHAGPALAHHEKAVAVTEHDRLTALVVPARGMPSALDVRVGGPVAHAQMIAHLSPERRYGAVVVGAGAIVTATVLSAVLA